VSSAPSKRSGRWLRGLLVLLAVGAVVSPVYWMVVWSLQRSMEVSRGVGRSGATS
jgi:ABC-type glycerol-3-phosphate transport system permease component